MNAGGGGEEREGERGKDGTEKKVGRDEKRDEAFKMADRETASSRCFRTVCTWSADSTRKLSCTEYFPVLVEKVTFAREVVRIKRYV